MSGAELRQLQEQIKRELKTREQSDRAKALEQIHAIAHSVGLPVMELVGGGVRARTGPVAPRYRKPADASQLWTGRGRQPKWVKDWLDAGKSLDLLRL